MAWPGPSWGAPGAGGPLGGRPGDRDLAAAAVGAGQPGAAGPGGVEAWCRWSRAGRWACSPAPARRAAVRRRDLAAVELLATGAALATDRLRFLRLWSRKLEQADAAHSQLLRYADDLRTTFSAERRRAEELGRPWTRSSWPTRPPSAPWPAPSRPRTPTPAATCPGHRLRDEACRALGGDLAATPGLEYAFLLHDLGKIGVPDAC